MKLKKAEASIRIGAPTRLAIVTLLAIHEHTKDNADAWFPITLLTERFNYSQSSIEQLFARLTKQGLIIGQRGRKGGYRLAKKPSEINLFWVSSAADRPQLSPEDAIQVPAFDRAICHALSAVSLDSMKA